MREQDEMSVAPETVNRRLFHMNTSRAREHVSGGKNRLKGAERYRTRSSRSYAGGLWLVG